MYFKKKLYICVETTAKHWHIHCSLSMKEQLFNGHYPMKHGTGLSFSLSVILYEEDKIHYAYCAALDILGYGNTEEEAKKSFGIMVEEILADAVSKGTLTALLKCYGWKQNRPPKTSDLIAHSSVLADIVDNKTYRTIKEKITLPSA